MDTYGFILLILKSSQKYYKVSMVTTYVNTYIEQRLPVEKRDLRMEAVNSQVWQVLFLTPEVLFGYFSQVIFFFPLSVLLRYAWHTALYKFSAYIIMTRPTYIGKWLSITLYRYPPNRYFFNSTMFFSRVSSISSFTFFPILESEVLEGVILLLLSGCSVLELLHCTSHFCLASRSKYELQSQGERLLLPQMFFICFPAEVSPVRGHFCVISQVGSSCIMQVM